jgi:superfamily II DNA/RNA helicase
VFTHWTEQTLHLIKDKLTVPYLAHYGTGQTKVESQRVRDDFKVTPEITCLLTSDAGKEAMNMQNARYVIQFEPAYSYDTEMQRAGRINRADSYLDGLTNYVYVTEDSVEERVLAINRTRQLIAEAVQGTVEAMTTDQLERAQRTEAANLVWLMFGDR